MGSCAHCETIIGPAVRADFRRLYPANVKTPTCCPSDDNRTKVTNSVTSARSLWWHVGPYFWPADLTRTANPITLRHGDWVPAACLCSSTPTYHTASTCSAIVSGAVDVVADAKGAPPFNLWGGKGLFQKLSWGGGPQTLFCPLEGGCLLTMCPRGGGGGVTCPGDQGIFDP